MNISNDFIIKMHDINAEYYNFKNDILNMIFSIQMESISDFFVEMTLMIIVLSLKFYMKFLAGKFMVGWCFITL